LDAREELIQRVARRRGERMGLSQSAYAELLLAVRKNPEEFIDNREDATFLALGRLLDKFAEDREGDDLLEDDEFATARAKRMGKLSIACEKITKACPTCVDARVVQIIASDKDPDVELGLLLDLRDELAGGPWTSDTTGTGDAWNDVFARPWLRLLSRIQFAALDSGRYRMCDEAGENALSLSPADGVGARRACALSRARLEDEEGLNRLEARFSHRGDSWFALSRVILLYKLGRMTAARRALRGMCSLCDGGAYALLRPILIDTYMPDRPQYAPYSFEEATLAVHEADPIILDVPDFALWAERQEDIASAGKSFAEEHGLDW
jgi:hypothetical protein